MTREQSRRRTLEALDRILNRGGDADAILRAVVETLRPLYDSVAIAFPAGRAVAAGHAAADALVAALPVRIDGVQVAELRAAPAAAGDGPFLERVALVISPYCRTAGEL